MPDLNEGRLDLPRSGPRFIAFGVAAIVLITALGGRLFQLQVVQGDEFARRAAADRTVEVPVTKIYPPRATGQTKMKPIAGWWSILRPLVQVGIAGTRKAPDSR